MKRTVLAALASALMLGFHAAAAPRTIDHIYGPPGELCTVSAPCTNQFAYPIPQGQSKVIDVEGQYVDLSTGLEVTGSGVTVSTPSNGTSSSNHKVKVTVSSDAEPGVRTVKLHYAVELNGPDTFKIAVIRNGKVTGVATPSPGDYFNDVNVTFNGTNLGNAAVKVLPQTVGTFSIGGQVPQLVTLRQTTASASVTSASASQAVVKFHFDGGPFAEAKATVLLYDKQLDNIGHDICETHRMFCYTGLEGPQTTNQNTADVIGPNAVSSITFPGGTSVTPGSPLTIKVTLVKPAKAGGEVIHWEVVPAASFVEATGSGTTFVATRENSATIPAGDQSKVLTVQFASEPAGCQKACQGKISTRMVNFTVDQLPYLQSAPFTMILRR